MLLGLTTLPPTGRAIATRGLRLWVDRVFAALSIRPAAFRDELRKRGGIVAGSSVLRAFENGLEGPCPWTNSKTDVFVPTLSFDAFCSFRTGSTGA